MPNRRTLTNFIWRSFERFSLMEYPLRGYSNWSLSENHCIIGELFLGLLTKKTCNIFSHRQYSQKSFLEDYAWGLLLYLKFFGVYFHGRPERFFFRIYSESIKSSQRTHLGPFWEGFLQRIFLLVSMFNMKCRFMQKTFLKVFFHNGRPYEMSPFSPKGVCDFF